MSLLSYDRYDREIVLQTGLLRAAIEGADLTVPVPSCPGWNVGQLVRHVGGAHRWATAIVATRATDPVQDGFRDHSAQVGQDPAVLGPWLAQGAADLTAALREAGPGTAVWTPVPGGSTNFGSLPMHFEVHPAMRELLGPGRTLHFHATDTAPEASAEWFVDLTGGAIAWRRSHEKAAVAVRAPLTDLLLIIYKRRPARGEGIEILGDEQLLDFWLERVSFG